MKKRILTIVVLIIVLVGVPLMIVVGKGGFREDAVAVIGNYSISEAHFKEYALLASLESESSLDAKLVAREYAKTQIATEEIRGTDYEVPAAKRNELLESETENFDRDYENNNAFCLKIGITHTELVDAVVTSKLNSYIRRQHLAMVAEKYIQRERELNPNKTFSAEELLEIYDNYMEEKVSALDWESLNDDKLQEIVTSYRSLDTAEMGAVGQ